MIERRTVTQEIEKIVRHYVCDRCGAVLSTEEAWEGGGFPAEWKRVFMFHGEEEQEAHLCPDCDLNEIFS